MPSGPELEALRTLDQRRYYAARLESHQAKTRSKAGAAKQKKAENDQPPEVEVDKQVSALTLSGTNTIRHQDKKKRIELKQNLF